MMLRGEGDPDGQGLIPQPLDIYYDLNTGRVWMFDRFAWGLPGHTPTHEVKKPIQDEIWAEVRKKLQEAGQPIEPFIPPRFPPQVFESAPEPPTTPKPSPKSLPKVDLMERKPRKFDLK